MKLEQLQSIVTQGETATVEFKKSTGQLRAAFETVCAFLNSQGGIVLIGVDAQGKILGQDITDNTRQEIAREIHKLEPDATLDLKYIAVNENKSVIVIQVKVGPHSPYTYDGRAFQRIETTTTRMSQHRYEQLLVERGQLNHSWEELSALGYDIDALDHKELQQAVKQSIAVNRLPAEAQSDNIEDILARWNLIEKGKLNNAAVVLFAKNTLPHYPQCHIKLARFKGITTLGDFIDNQEFFGNAFQLLAEANHFIRKHLPIASFFESSYFERTDQPTLPMLAVREALVNAICHRDYSNRSASIALAIFDDRMEIWNNGTLTSPLKLEDLKKKHRSFPRNKIIAKVFYDRKFFEGWGTGTNKILDICQAAHVPEPVFEEYSGGFAVVFPFKTSIGFSRPQPVAEPPALNFRQEEILRVLQTAPLRADEIFSQLSSTFSASLRTIKADLSALKKLGLVEQQGKARSAVWRIKR